MQKKPKDMDLHNMAWIISSLDMAVYGSPVHLDYIEKILKNYEKKYEGIRYERVISSLKNIEQIILKKIYTESVRKRLKFLNYGTRFFLISAIIIAFISIFYRMPILLALFYSFFIASVLLLLLNYIMLKSIDRKIENLDDPDYLKEKDYIKEVNQYLINILLKKIKEKGAISSDYRIPLKSDYKNIEIISRSGFMKKYYVGVVKDQP